MKKFFENWLRNHHYWFSNYRWYRKWYGGKWECWWTDIVYSNVWYNELSLNTYKGRPSAIAKQFIKSEEW